MKIIIALLLIILSTHVFAAEINLKDLQMPNSSAPTRSIAQEKGSASNLFSTRNLAWTTMALLGATGLTGQEKDVSSTHIALASLTSMSYGAFIHSYFNNPEIQSTEGATKYKWASYSKWLHIPAMVILPVAGALAQRQFAKGENSATGFAVTHKPAALASVIGMALATLSLTFEF